ncbi:MAG: zinc-ribbon domain-containing protein [Bacteroidales bacterium]|nr:zinc-ribbon domain-containing protein [Bacteroidales bacterium]
MALITCSQCGHEISDKANHCPHCGKKVEKKFFTKTRIVIGVIILVAIVAIIISVYSIYILRTRTSDKVDNPSEDTKEEATTVKDIDGNVYKTVKIGNQVWMAENLRTTRYANGESIPLGTSTSTVTSYRYNPDDDANNVSTYGYLYNWPAVMHGSSSSSSNPSGVQGICPDGWHVPSDAEWTELTDYVGSQSEYRCGGDRENIAKALASTKGWETDNGSCAVGNNQSANNATGFSALPAGIYGGGYYGFGYCAGFWGAAENNGYDACYRSLYYDYAYVVRGYYYKYIGFSVRCVRD